MHKIKYFGLSLFVFLFLEIGNIAFGADGTGPFGINNVSDGLIGNKENTLATEVRTLIIYLLGFIALIAVIWLMKGGFHVLTAGGDDEKTKKGKRTVLFALLGCVVIWFAYALISGVFFSLEQSG